MEAVGCWLHLQHTSSGGGSSDSCSALNTRHDPQQCSQGQTRPSEAARDLIRGHRSYFTTRWRSYVQAVQLTDKDIPIQLLECCDAKLRRDVTQNEVGPSSIEEMSVENLSGHSLSKRRTRRWLG